MKAILKRLAAWAALLPVIASGGCREVNGTLYSEYSGIPGSGWDPSAPLYFDPWPADSLNVDNPLDVIIRVRYSGRRAIAPLRMAVELEDIDGTLASDTLVMPLFDGDGLPTGRGHYGVYEVRDTILSTYRLKDCFNVEMKALDPAEATAGLVNVGVVLTRTQGKQ